MTPRRSACCGRAGSRPPGPTSRNSSPWPPAFLTPLLLSPLRNIAKGEVCRVCGSPKPPAAQVRLLLLQAEHTLRSPTALQENAIGLNLFRHSGDQVTWFRYGDNNEHSKDQNRDDRGFGG